MFTCTEGGIYFILQHYKQKVSKISTKCFSILELDEIEEGPIALEMWVKPIITISLFITVLSIL